uniref:RING-type domain-containing protein n=1 Tax=Timema cristinae TaxID=61476 RepID=A0A7R9CLL6_TIMCR|nr:unnamed protein product [Timema cristinae]
MEPEKMDTAPLVKQEVDENSTLCNQVGAEIPSEVNEETAPSPTTGDEPPVNPWCVIKCVFCLQMLSSNDNPKLMECLHTACSSCVAAKLNEQLDGEVIVASVVQKGVNIPVGQQGVAMTDSWNTALKATLKISMSCSQ